jgi:uncharacterized protein YjbJ (UPF0337 family)
MKFVQAVATLSPEPFAQVARGRLRRRMLDWQFRQSGSEWKEFDMNWDIVEGNWKQFKGKLNAQWDKLSNNRLDVIAGNRVGLTGTRQEASPKGECMMNEVIPPRRVVLRGALAVAAGLWVPITISGCDSKKGETSSSAAPASAPSTGTDSAASAAPAASKKVSQASVQYQSQPKGEQKCGGCQHFIAASNTCELVDGQISPDGWCKLWAKKA